MLDRISEYGHKLRILRQVQSNKAKRYSRINTTDSVATVVVSSVLTFMGFAGIDKVHTYVNWVATVDKTVVEFLFNLCVLLLFVLVILHLVFRFTDLQSRAERAVVSLTHLINEIDDMISRSDHGQFVAAQDIQLVREKYQMLIQVIPANSDREFLAAKRDFREKVARASSLQLAPKEIFDPARQRNAIDALIRSSEVLMRILTAIRKTDERLYLAGGLVRNTVWDYLHGYGSPTPIDDVDVVYMDGVTASKERDLEIETKLRRAVPNLQWSVRNQARMHLANQEDPYTSLMDAVSKFPEVATALAVRLQEDNQLEIIAPHGFDDLFRLIVAPTPHFKGKLDRFRDRVGQKNWMATWPRLRVQSG